MIKPIICGVILSLGVYGQETVNQLITVDASQFQKLMQEHQGSLLDIRTPGELKSDGYLEGNTNIDFYAKDFKNKIKALDKTKTYFIYCRSGRRSAMTLEFMKTEGFTQVYDLGGGIMGWKEAKLPIKM